MHSSRIFWLRRAAAVLGLVLVLQACDDPAPATVTIATTSPRATVAPGPATASPAAASPTDYLDAAARGDWRPAPLAADGGFLARFEATCVAAEPAIGGMPAVLRELRGKGHVTVIFGEANRDDPAFLCRGSIDASAATDLDVIPLDAGRDPIRDEAIDIIRYEVVEGRDGDAQTVLIGRVGRAAIRVLAGFADESEVEGAKGGGWYAMWWPGTVAFTGAAAVNRQNAVIGDVAPPGPPAEAP